MRLLHAIHDFLPRHRAGSEIYVAALAKAQSSRHHVTVLCAEYDLARAHGHVTWRVHDGLPVVEIVNNWVGGTFEDTYRSALMTERVDQILDAVQPDVIHIHNLLNLSMDLPARARARGIPVVATLHDYTLVCPSGGQRVHRAESHVCWTIEPERCARCFKESPLYTQLAVGAIAGAIPGGWVKTMAGAVGRTFPQAAARAASTASRAAVVSVTAADIETRLARARQVFDQIDLFVAPSESMASEFVKLGVHRGKMRVSRNGHVAMASVKVERPRSPVRIGFVGSIVWHKGVHLLVDALRTLPRKQYELRIFGDERAAPDYAADLRRRVSDLPVRFEGGFAPGEAAAAFAEIDVLVVPSIWPENAPLVIQEAFQAGVPVIGSRIGGIPEFIQDDDTGWLFESNSTTSLAAVLQGLMADPERIAAASRRVLALESPLKSIDADVRDWDDRYAEVACARDSRAS